MGTFTKLIMFNGFEVFYSFTLYLTYFHGLTCVYVCYPDLLVFGIVLDLKMSPLRNPIAFVME